jgi:hypothetical protein
VDGALVIPLHPQQLSEEHPGGIFQRITIEPLANDGQGHAPHRRGIDIIPAFAPPCFHLCGWNAVEPALGEIDRGLRREEQRIGVGQLPLRLMKIFLRLKEDTFVVRVPVVDFNDHPECALQAGRGKMGIQFQGTFESLSR